MPVVAGIVMTDMPVVRDLDFSYEMPEVKELEVIKPKLKFEGAVGADVAIEEPTIDVL